MAKRAKKGPKKAPKPTAELRRKAAEQVRRCHTLADAARLLGHEPDLFERWYQDGYEAPGQPRPSLALRRWRRAIDQARAAAIDELLEDMRHAGFETKKEVRVLDWRATERLLAALDPYRFDRRNVNRRLIKESMERFILELRARLGEDEFEPVARAAAEIAADIYDEG